MSPQIELADGRVELTDRTRVEASPLYNHDLAPVPISKRNWTTYNYAALWISMAHCIPTYMLASALIASGMNWWQALLTVGLGNTIVLIPILLNSHPGTKYGIPFPVFARAAYGTIGSNLPAYALRRSDLVRLKASLLRIPHVVVTDVPVFMTREGARGVDAKPLIPPRTVALVFLSSVNDLTIRAVNFAKSLDASVTRAIYFDLDPEAAHKLETAWFDAGLEVPLDIVEAPFRDLTGPMLEEVRRYSSDPGTVVNVIVPEVIVSHWWQLPLHNQNALFIKRLFLYEDRVVLSSVPMLVSGTPTSETETV